MIPMDAWQTFMIGAGGAAIVKGLFDLAHWFLNRKAQKEDRADGERETKCAARGEEIRRLDRKVDVLFLAERTILYDRIKFLAKSYIARGWVTVEELEDLNRMHEVYHDEDKLNGNGFLSKLMKKVNTGLETRAE